jgi:hypothetical protein
MERYDRNEYGRYEGYDANDRHYHSARNLTDEFEREYQHDRGNFYDDRRPYNREHSYHEGSMGGAYERLKNERQNVRRNNNDFERVSRNQRYPEDYNNTRNRYSNYQDDYRSYSGMNRSDADHTNRERYNNFDRYREDRGNDSRNYYPESRGGNRRPWSEGSFQYPKTQDNWYSPGHRNDEFNRYY